MKAVGAGDWGAALLAHTWKPFGLVAGFATAFAVFAAMAAPQARSAMEVIAVLSKGND